MEWAEEAAERGSAAAEGEAEKLEAVRVGEYRCDRERERESGL